jgi:hypothetical protein
MEFGGDTKIDRRRMARGAPSSAAARLLRPAALSAARLPLLTVLAVLGLVAFAAPATAAEGEGEGFGVDKWEAGTCREVSCRDPQKGETTSEKQTNEAKFYTQAAGHPIYGITDFRIDSAQSSGVLGEVHIPEGHVDNVRVDLPQGLAVDPEAVEECSQGELEESKCPAGSQVGEDEATGTVNVSETVAEKIEKIIPLGVGTVLKGIVPLSSGLESLTITEKFKVFNMQRLAGKPARFGVEVKSPTLELAEIEAQIYLEGGLSWYAEPEAPGGESSHVTTGDFHEYFRIPNIPEAPEVVESKLIFWGRPHEFNAAAPNKTFITMPSTCNGPQTTLLHISSHAEPDHFLFYENETPVGATGCGSLPARADLSQNPETAKSDAPDGTEVILKVPQGTEDPTAANAPNVESAEVTLPEGMTLNPSAANGLQACTNEEIGIGTDKPVECPAKSIIGTVAVDAPGIPDGSLTGEVYLGAPKAKTTQNPHEAESGEEYRIFIAAYSERYGVGVRIEGRVHANEATGRLTGTFSDLPQVPFEIFALRFRGGAQAPLANPLLCGAASISGSVFPYTGAAAATPASAFTLQGSGGGACSAPPFSPSQAAAASPATGGSHTSFTLGFTRAEGQQYLSNVSTTLPEGLVGEIPAVTLCHEPQARTGDCPAESRIGTATVAIGSGPEPYGLSGSVYLTGPYGGAPYGLSIVVPATSVGPYDFGDIVTRAKIEIDSHTARVRVTSPVPTIVGGAPLRLRSVSVKIDHPGFLLNPTNCSVLATESTLTSQFGATSALSTPFQASGCESLGFEPKLTASTQGKTSRKRGASLSVKVTEPAVGANVLQARVTLPKKLVARLATLNEACLLSVFEANPSSCPADSAVGHATVSTPVLPHPLEGQVYFVSLGHAGFPNLDVVLEGDGVTVILTGQTNIKGRYTHSNFTSLPDVPFSSFSLTVPEGKHSALFANGNLCKHRRKLRMRTELVGQNAKKLQQKTKIEVEGCKDKKARHGKRRHDHRSHDKRSRDNASHGKRSRAGRQRRHRQHRR